MVLSLIEHIRDDVCKASLEKLGAPTILDHFMFMFILINNIIGLIPGAHPGTGTIGVTALVFALGYFMYVGAKKMGAIGRHP